MKNLKGKRIKIEEEQIKNCNKFILESVEDHLSYGRTKDVKKHNIFLGKMGEVGFKNICDDNNVPCTDVKFESKLYGDGGIDNIIEDGLKIDVKTLDSYEKDGIIPFPYEKKQRVYVKSLNCDAWVLMRLNSVAELYYAEYIGRVYKKDLENHHFGRDRTDGIYLNKKLFEDSKY